MNLATGVAVDTVVTVTFSEPMGCATVNSSTFTIDNGVTGTVVCSGATATFTPSATLDNSTVYSATITTGAEDAAGNPLATSHTWSFTTRPPPLNDSGTRPGQCYQVGSDTLVACDSAGALALSGAQDGMVGRDAQPATNDGTDGLLGFSFSTVPAAGSDPGNCVLDNVTGLMWEVKTIDGGLRDRDRTFTNYDANYNPGGFLGSATDASGYAAAVNATQLCGYSDWRLPTVDELLSVIDYGGYNPALDEAWFPYSLSITAWYWTSEAVFRVPRDAWFVDAWGGSADRSIRDYNTQLHVWLVRAGETPPSTRYVVAANGQEVVDRQTGLTWRRCVEGMSWDGTGCTGTPSLFQHEAALQHAAAQAANTGVAWRVPNVKELASLVVRSTGNPTIDTQVFPNTPAAGAWSTTPRVDASGSAWMVEFLYGRVANFFRIDAFGGLGVRLVRSPP